MQLYRQRDAFRRLNAEVLLISFGTPESARQWQQVTEVNYPHLLDPDRLVYKAYEIERSFFHSWNLKTVWEYVQLMLAGRKWRGIQGDSLQLGGDFVIDTRGVVQMAYYSQDPTDRPAVADLVASLRRLEVAGS